MDGPEARGNRTTTVVAFATWARAPCAPGAKDTEGRPEVSFWVLDPRFFCPVAFASTEPRPLAEVRAAAGRLVRGVRRALLVGVGSASPRPAAREGAGIERGILGQLRRALSISPLAPPLALTPVADLFGPARPSGHRAEVAACP